MYSLDINLLRERAEYQTATHGTFTADSTMSGVPRKHNKIPMFVGMGVAAIALAVTGGGWMFVGQQTTQLEAKQKELDQKLGSLKAQDARLEQLNAQLGQVNSETQSLAGVFNTIQPWSAIMQDLRESIPQGVQIATIAQTDTKGTAAPAPAAAPPAAPQGGLINKISTPPNPEAKPSAAPSPTAAAPAPSTPGAAPAAGTPVAAAPATATLPADVPTAKLDISGTAKSFDDVNNFILTLKQSAFFNPDETQLLSASLVAGPALTKIEPKVNAQSTVAANPVNQTKMELPKVVEYRIQTSLKRIPAADLIRDLERKGAVGLVTRLKSLQQQQVIK